MRLVVDASVAVKWFLHNKPGEQDVKQALTILSALRNGEANAIQPPHWLVEAMSVLAREAPPFAEEALEDLEALKLPIAMKPGDFRLAVRLSRQLNHHVFDTLYHAVALEHDATLVTADEAYFTKAFRLGNIMLLVNYPAP
jgi:predicted nucleic acid-binding protein